MPQLHARSVISRHEVGVWKLRAENSERLRVDSGDANTRDCGVGTTDLEIVHERGSAVRSLVHAAPLHYPFKTAAAKHRVFPRAHCISHYPLETWVFDHVQTHGQCEGATYSHCKVTMSVKSWVCCGWNVADRWSNYGSWSALRNRDLVNYSAEWRHTACNHEGSLALVGRLSTCVLQGRFHDARHACCYEPK
jgi:hypothetical protein